MNNAEGQLTTQTASSCLEKWNKFATNVGFSSFVFFFSGFTGI
jgi:hypothetical protein